MQPVSPSAVKERRCVVLRPICINGERVEVDEIVTLPNERAHELKAANRVRFEEDPASEAAPTSEAKPQTRRRR